MSFSRVAAEHWLWTVSSDYTSKAYNINDVGFFRRPNDYGFIGALTYKEDRPADLARNYSIRLFLHERENFDDANILRQAQVSGSVLAANYWFNAGSRATSASTTTGQGTGCTRARRCSTLHRRAHRRRYDVNGSLAFAASGREKRTGWGRRGSVSPSMDGVQVGRATTGCRTRWHGSPTRRRPARHWRLQQPGTQEMGFTLRRTITFTPDLTLQYYGQLFIAKRALRDFSSWPASDFVRIRTRATPTSTTSR
jgi:hypothetical protein